MRVCVCACVCVCVCVYLKNLTFPRTKRLIGYDTDADSLDADRLRHYIFGGHVSDYMRHMQEEDEEKYKSHFSRYIKEGITPDNVRFPCCCSLTTVPVYLLFHTHTHTHAHARTHAHSWNKCIKMHTQKYVQTHHMRQSPREKISSPRGVSF